MEVSRMSDRPMRLSQTVDNGTAKGPCVLLSQRDRVCPHPCLHFEFSEGAGAESQDGSCMLSELVALLSLIWSCFESGAFSWFMQRADSQSDSESFPPSSQLVLEVWVTHSCADSCADGCALTARKLSVRTDLEETRSRAAGAQLNGCRMRAGRAL